MVDTDERQRFFGELLDQLLGNATASPIFTRTEWRLYFLGSSQVVGRVNAQTIKTRLGCLSARIIDANVPLECGAHARVPRVPGALATMACPLMILHCAGQKGSLHHGKRFYF